MGGKDADTAESSTERCVLMHSIHIQLKRTDKTKQSFDNESSVRFTFEEWRYHEESV